MELILYYSPGACSLAAHIALEESKLDFTTRPVVIADNAHHQPEYLALNPRGRIPTLLIDGTPVRELSAILSWIAAQAPHLAPRPGTIEAAQCSEWLAWFTSTLHITFATIWRGERFVNDPALHSTLRDCGMASLGRQFLEIERHLETRRWFVADTITVVDFNALVFFRWANRLEFETRALYPNWTAHAQNLCHRAAVQLVCEREGISIWN